MNQLIIVCGLSFSGKSTLGKAIADRFGCVEVDVDETKFSLYGQNTRDEDLKREDWVRIYAETDRLIENLLDSCKTVVDASRNFSKSERGSSQVYRCQGRCPVIDHIHRYPRGCCPAANARKQE